MFSIAQNSLTIVLYTIILCLIATTTTGDVVPRPRGVSLALAGLYQQPVAGKNWKCLDGSKEISYLYINDDYCDCLDGSDEPGTSACQNGRFNCLNTGHKSIDIPSSRINDGICDCCDGSDEYVLVSCPNTCQELGRAEQLQRKNQEELHKRGAETRKDLINRGKQLRAERDARKVDLDYRLKEQIVLKSEKEQLRNDAEAIEAEALEIFKKKHSENAANIQAEKESQQLREEANLKFQQYDVNKDGFVDVTELRIDAKFDRDGDGLVTVEEANYFLDERERMDLDTFVALAWPRIKSLQMLSEGIFKPPIDKSHDEAIDMASDDKEQKQPETDTEPQSNQGHSDVETYGEDEETEEDQYEEDEEPDVGVGEASAETATPEPEYDPETQHKVEQANKARNEFSEVERQIREIEHEIKEINEQNGKDYGLNEEYATMDGKCYKFEDREYVYTLCPFDRASQKQRSGGAETTLGRWDQWIGEDNNKYSKQKYTNGASCWNGPQRSAVVNIACALESKVTAVSEPNRCEYHFEFETPAACDSQAFLEDGQNRHDEL